MSAEVEAPEVKSTVADRDTRCRNCWGRIRRSDPAIADSHGILFHSNCRPIATSFPVIGSIDDQGNSIEEFDGDHPYRRRRRR